MQLSPLLRRSLEIIAFGFIFAIIHLLILAILMVSSTEQFIAQEMFMAAWLIAFVLGFIALCILERAISISEKILQLPTLSFVLFSCVCFLLSPLGSFLSDPILAGLLGERSGPILQITETLWFGLFWFVFPMAIPIIILLWGAAFIHMLWARFHYPA